MDPAAERARAAPAAPVVGTSLRVRPRTDVRRTARTGRCAGRCTGARRLLLFSACIFAATACRVVDAKVWNLRELHRPDGTYRRTGVLYNDLEFVIRTGLEGVEFAQLRFAERDPEVIEDPYGECLENLIDLEDLDSADPVHAGLQVEMFTWLAVADPYVLARERCVIGLGRAGARLGVAGPYELPPDVPVAGAAEVREAVRALLVAVEEVASAPGEFTQHPANQLPLGVEEACERMRGLVLDREGARRALAVTIILARRLAGEPAAKPLSELQADLERRCVGLALSAALRDPEPLVQAAALEACVRSSGNELPGLVRQALTPTAHPEVALRALRVIAERGLPEPEGGLAALDPAKREKWRWAWVGQIVDAFCRPDDPANGARVNGTLRVAACQALGAVANAGFEDLHYERWFAWWLANRPAPNEAQP